MKKNQLKSENIKMLNNIKMEKGHIVKRLNK